MSGYLREEHLQLQEAARRFTDKEVRPIASELDRKEADIPEHIIKKMAQLGYYGLLIPSEYGGSGIDHISMVIITEELCRGWLSVGSLIGRNVIVAWILNNEGSEEQKEKWLPALSAGQIQVASAATEPEAGSDAANIRTRATKNEAGWILNGTKMFCTNADRANLLLVYARTDPEAKPKHRGISILAVEKEPGDTFKPPHIVGSRIPLVGYHGVGTFELAFQDCAVPEENLIGPLNQGFKVLMKAYESARIQFTARCIGVAQAAFEAALKYSKQRVQFDVPISSFQAIRFKLADMAAAIESARQFNYYVAWKKDAGKSCDLEAGMAKLLASEMALKITWDAVQIHGGYGYTKEFSVERYWRDAGMLPIGEGTSEIQREIIARKLLGE